MQRRMSDGRLIGGFVSERESRAADDDAKPAIARERRDDVVGDAVGQVLLAAEDASFLSGRRTQHSVMTMASSGQFARAT